MVPKPHAVICDYFSLPTTISKFHSDLGAHSFFLEDTHECPVRKKKWNAIHRSSLSIKKVECTQRNCNINRPITMNAFLHKPLFLSKNISLDINVTVFNTLYFKNKTKIKIHFVLLWINIYVSFIYVRYFVIFNRIWII